MFLCRKLVEKLGEEKILLGDSVTSIMEQEESDVKVTTASGKEYHTRSVIVAVPCSTSGKQHIQSCQYFQLIVNKTKYVCLFIVQNLDCSLIVNSNFITF